MSSQNGSHHESTSASLLVRVRDPADASAWREFEDRYATLIRCYCTRRRIEPADVDDISQIVWSKLANGLRNFCYDPAKGRFRSYLYQVVRSAISRQFAHKRRDERWLESHEDLAHLIFDDSQHDEVWNREWVDHHFRLAMQTIEQTFDSHNVAIFHRLLAGESAEIIARSLGTTAGTINQAKHRIRSRMKELVALQVLEEDNPARFAEVVGKS